MPVPRPHQLGAMLLLTALAVTPSRAPSPTTGDGSHTVTVTFRDSDRYHFSADERAAITAIAETTIAEVARLLPGLPEHITITVQESPQVIPETGDGGLTLRADQILWTVDGMRPGGALAVARAHLRTTLYHEFHHVARGWLVEGSTVGRRIIDAAVSEGLATAFARDEAGADEPWAHYPDSARAWAEELAALPPSAAAKYQEWMFQHPDGRRWIGYRAGTFIADQAIAASGRSARDLVTVPTDSILEMAGVTDR